MVRFFIECRAPIDMPARNELGSQPIHWAASGGHVPVVDLLLEAGAHPNKPGNRDGQTVLEALLDPQVGCEAVSAAHECVRAGADHRKVSAMLTLARHEWD